MSLPRARTGRPAEASRLAEPHLVAGALVEEVERTLGQRQRGSDAGGEEGKNLQCGEIRGDTGWEGGAIGRGVLVQRGGDARAKEGKDLSV
jgi:hypothetical protein